MASFDFDSIPSKHKSANHTGNDDVKYIPVVKHLNLQIKREDIEGSKLIELDNASSVIDMIDQNSQHIKAEFDKWTRTERRIFKTHFNELIYGATYLGNILVDDTKTFKDRLEELSVMREPANLQRFTDELLDNGFVDEGYFYGRK